MARELQNQVLALVEHVLGARLEREVAPAWLMRPGERECGDAWPTIQEIYSDLTGGGNLPSTMPPRERRSIDAVFAHASGARRLVEVDEVQHFTPPRAMALARYPTGTRVAFDMSEWATRAAGTLKLRGGGFARPCPPLFPHAGGRHLQRAFRDSLADLLPSQHGWAPTLRIGDFEVKGWLSDANAASRMHSLLIEKGIF